jgi:hypothetical protein
MQAGQPKDNKQKYEQLWQQARLSERQTYHLSNRQGDKRTTQVESLKDRQTGLAGRRADSCMQDSNEQDG